MKKIKKIGSSQLAEMVKKTLNELNVGGINYDADVAAELKGKVGDLSKLTPYALELGDNFPLNVTSDNTGKVKVYDGQKLVKIYKDVEDFLKGIKYGPVKVNEDDAVMGHGEHKDHEASMAKGELRSLVKNAKAIYEKINDGDELPGWVSSYVTLASDYMNSVNQYMEEKVNGDQSLEESDDSSRKIKLADLVEKYGLEKTGSSGKFMLSDFQPILDGGDEDDKYALAEHFANAFLSRSVGLYWDDLPDINSLWDCVESSDTVKDLMDSVKDACRERLEEDGGEGMFD